jgi:2-methylisocitrate lyase-like PEP mutase family enzyme
MLRRPYERPFKPGVVGITLEDNAHGDDGVTLFVPAAQSERIRADRQVATGFGSPLTVDARTDVSLVA